MTDKATGLALLREPFPPHLISKLPKPTKKQTEEVRADFRKGIRCQVCGGWHHPNVVHLDYVGHAALTSRLLDCDPNWNWEPVAAGETGLPLIDENGGMWIKLTVCGVSRLGYGHPDGKRGGDAIKEVIGDALRNAAMRFGAALDLWHKGDLHVSADAGSADDDPNGGGPEPERASDRPSAETIATAKDALGGAVSLDDLQDKWSMLPKAVKATPAVASAKDARKTQLMAAESAANEAPLVDDEIPY